MSFYPCFQASSSLEKNFYHSFNSLLTKHQTHACDFLGTKVKKFEKQFLHENKMIADLLCKKYIDKDEWRMKGKSIDLA